MKVFPKSFRIFISLHFFILFFSLLNSSFVVADDQTLFSEGLDYFKNEEYEKANEAFKQAVEADPSDASAHFFIGLIYQKKNQHQKSISSFQKAMALDSEFAQLSLYNIGLAYSKMDQYDQAKDAFTNAIAIKPQSDTAKDSQNFLDILSKRKKEKKRWGFEARVGWEYDDNVTRIEQDVATGEKDSAAVFELEVGYKIVDTPDYGLQVSYDFFQSKYNTVTDFNFQTHSFTLSGSKELEKWDAGIDYNYSYNRLGGEEFLAIHSLTPSVGLSIIPNSYTNVSYIFQNKEFYNDAERDANNHSIGFDQFFFFMESKAYLNFSYRLDNEAAAGNEFDYVGHLLTAGVQAQLPFQSKGKISYKYNLKDYKNITPSIGEERRDNKHTLNLALTKKIIKNLEFKVDYQRINSNSNLPSTDFSENIIFLGLALVL